ncbi:arylamine N-acetyltransferase family protein [Dactylosporangium matsuzakiense]|uniref:N-hydroxyarylamine O-acetyltransferase n=1 Tax=Dactylosporangium matsuzakiense TaxID=53360 RepID=A0A9W6KHK3_9ACTN|nr:arylamine N-acetyltransferase [Dactylosporangium matsuzakiense]UWZ48884.1 arylamine N-acetyltransferase [Dactylosporangium matsuzakiense]GLL00900.1 N-hydroxyarylamine O-acetyltransferase [Dactylosporangium matsuzakiense]
MDDYLARIGITERPSTPDIATLRRIQRAHLGTVPFENLSIHLGEPVGLGDDELLDKIVNRRRGGFCYEVNGALALLLRDLGYTVTLHSARTWNGTVFGFPFDHMVLRVELEHPWLVDVGFGKFAHHPLRLDTAGPQADPGGVYTVTEDGGELIVTGPSEYEYKIDPRPYLLRDFGPTCWYQQTSPQSHFTKGPTCSRVTEDGGRITLSGHRLIRTTGDTKAQRTLTDEEALLAYRTEFGIELTRLPEARTPA